MDWSVHYNTIYAVHGVAAVLTPNSSLGETDVTAIDKTAGVVVGESVDVQTIRPGAMLRMSELASNGIAADELDDGTIELNDKTWLIKAHLLRPSPTGEATGEVLLILQE